METQDRIGGLEMNSFDLCGRIRHCGLAPSVCAPLPDVCCQDGRIFPMNNCHLQKLRRILSDPLARADETT